MNENLGPFQHPRSRMELQQWLEAVTGKGPEQVLFQPPSSDKRKYPCWEYRLVDMSQDGADNIIYKTADCYEITFITQNPDSKWINAMKHWPRSRFVRSFQSGGYNHYVYRFWTAL